LISPQEETIEVNRRKIARVGANPRIIVWLLLRISARPIKKMAGRTPTIYVPLVILTGAAEPDSL
jgi:hypothetical protein